jgi:hypothetical protein
MTIETLRDLKAILWRCFVLGTVFTLLSALLFYGIKPQWKALVVDTWHLFDGPSLERVILQSWAAAKLILFYGFLIPALAICWYLNKKSAA